MNFKERLTNIAGIMKNTSDETLGMYKFVIIGLVVADLLGLWWYLQWKTLAMGLFLVLIAFLCWILFEERNRAPLEIDDKTKPKLKPKKSDEPNNFEMPDIIGNMDLGIDMGNLNKSLGVPTIADSKTYNKRLNQQLKQ